MLFYMADLVEAFNTIKSQKKPFQNLDFFFTQRAMTEEQEYFDKNMNRKIKKLKVVHNFLALNIPTISITSNNNSSDKLMGFDIEIYGDEGYHYKGNMTSFQGIIPNFMIPIKADKKLFVNITYKFADNNDNNINKKFINFIEVPKRFQQTIENTENTENELDL